MSGTGKEIVIRKITSNVPGLITRVDTLTDLFNLAAGDNISALEHDLEAAGWPDLEEIDNPEIRVILNDYSAELDPNDIKSIQNYAKSAIDDFEKLYRRFSQNNFLNSQLSQASALARKGAKIDSEDLLGRLEPLFEKPEERSEFRKWVDKYNPFVEKSAPKITPQEIIRQTTEVELDLNAQVTMLAGMASKSRRLITSLEMQKENLQNSHDDMQKAEIMLFIAYRAARDVLIEWHSDEVANCYLGLSPQMKLQPYEMPEDTITPLPETPQQWGDATFELNMRLVKFYTAFTESRAYLNKIPDSIAEIDQLIEFYKEVEQQLSENWKSIADNVRSNVEYVRAQVTIERIMKEAENVVTQRVNHERKMAEFKKKLRPATDGAGTAPANENSALAVLENASKKTIEKNKARADALEEKFKRACDTSDFYGEKLGQPKMVRPEGSLIASVERSKRAALRTTEKRKGFFG